MKIRLIAAAAVPFSLLTLTALMTGAHAQIAVTFQPLAPVYASSLPQTIAFTATIDNQFGTPIYLNSDFSSVDAPLTLDDSPFQNQFVPMDAFGNPLPQPVLASGKSTATLFDLLVPGGTAVGDYNGLFVLQGGGDIFSGTDLASPTFTLDVLKAPVPEASTTISFGLLLMLGLGGMVIAARKKARNA